MNNGPQWIVIAHIVRPQGRRGEVIADILTDFPERFGERREVMLLDAEGNPLRSAAVESHWLHKGRVVLKFVRVDSISEAEVLRGLDVAIPRGQRVSLDEDSVYISDLTGCHVIQAGRDIGRIIAVDRETADAPLLVLEATDTGEELLIPFVKTYLMRIDVEQKRIEMDLPEGLLDINSTPFSPE